MKQIEWEVTVTSGDTYSFQDDEHTYTLYGTRTGNDKNGNPLFEITCLVADLAGTLRYVKVMRRKVTSYNIKEMLIGIAGRM